jgi:hypothetical protein
MARPFVPAVNLHVHYFKTTTRKPWPGTITAVAGGGSTTLGAQANAGATTLTTVATAAVGQHVIIDPGDGTKWEDRVVSNATGAGPFTLTVPALQRTHLNGATVLLVPTSVTLRITHTGATFAGVARDGILHPRGTGTYAPY